MCQQSAIEKRSDLGYRNADKYCTIIIAHRAGSMEKRGDDEGRDFSINEIK